MNLFRVIYNFFDKLEDKVRRRMSHWPIAYALLGGVGVVLFWRGVWHTADYLMEWLSAFRSEEASLALAASPWWDGPLSLVVGTAMLLLTGILVSSFIGNEIILSGLRGEKKLAERTETEVKTEAGAIGEIQADLVKIHAKLDQLEVRPKRPARKKAKLQVKS